MSGPIYVDPLCGARFGTKEEGGLELLIKHRNECKAKP